MKPTKDYQLMENMFSEFPDLGGLHYYRKKMPTQTGKDYESHVFFTDPMPSEKLSRLWKKMTAVIAVRIQSEVDELIERSNFYICFFVSDEPEPALISAVESDEFCARKYVMPPFAGAADLDEIIGRINNKLFYFSDDPQEPVPEKAVHVDSITLSNFRAYENTRELKFGCKGGDASLVLIYAKNGVGKTSIFDGLEFLFKGEVERIRNLEKTNKNSQSPSATLHNLRHQKEEAFVSAILSDDLLLKRRVQKLSGNNKNDLRRLPVRKNEGRDFIGPPEEGDKWNEIILPHDRIDGFTTVKSPEEVYEEWIRHSNLQSESDEFLRVIKAAKAQANVIAGLTAKEKTLKEEIAAVSQGQSEVEEIIRLIGEFNALKNASGFPAAKDLTLSREEAVRSYDQLINSAKACARQIRDLYETEVLPGKKELDLISEKGRDHYAKAHQSYDALVEMKTKLEKDLEAARGISRLEEQIAQAEKDQVACERQQEEVRQVLALGGEASVRQSAIEIEKRKARKETLRARTAELMEGLRKTTARSEAVKASQAVLERTISENYPLILDTAKDYRKESGALTELRQAEAKYRNDIDSLTAAISSRRITLDNLREICLPRKLSQLDANTLQMCGSLVGNDQTKGLYELRSKYIKVQAQVDDLDRQMRQDKDELSALLALAGKYVSDHPETCDCPVCGKHHRSHDGLLKVIEGRSAQKQNALLDQMSMLQKQAEGLEREYSGEAAALKRKMEAMDSDLSKAVIDATKQRQKLTDNLDGVYAAIKAADFRLGELRAALKENGISFESDPSDAVAQWYLSVSGEQKAARAEWEDLLAAKKDLEAQIQAAQEEQAVQNARLQSLEEDHALQQSISFVAGKTGDWSAENEHTQLLRRIEELTDARKELVERLAAERKGDIQSAEFISRQLEELGLKLDALKADEEIYKKYYASEGNGPAVELAELTRREEACRKELDLLGKIVEENSARVYFEKYNQVLAAQEENAGKLKAARKEERELKKRKDQLKAELEKKLYTFFNQPAMSSIYKKIDPHRRMKDVHYVIEFSEEDKPQLYTRATDGETEIRPEWYFSTAQLNTLVFSTFFSRALKSDLALKTIFVDDPIAHFDDMNILGFADLLRCLIMETPFQFVISTHDRKIYDILRRKLDDRYYRARFIEL